MKLRPYGNIGVTGFPLRDGYIQFILELPIVDGRGRVLGPDDRLIKGSRCKSPVPDIIK